MCFASVHPLWVFGNPPPPEEQFSFHSGAAAGMELEEIKALDADEAEQPTVMWYALDGSSVSLTRQEARLSLVFATIQDGDSETSEFRTRLATQTMLTLVATFLRHESMEVQRRESDRLLGRYAAPVYLPIRGKVLDRRLANVQPVGTYSQWDSDFVYAVYTSPRADGGMSDGSLLQELWEVCISGV